MVFFESPHRTAAALTAMAEALGCRPAGRGVPGAHQDPRGGRPRRTRRAGRVGRPAGCAARSPWWCPGAPARAVVPSGPAELAALVAAEEAAGSTRKDAIRAVAQRAGLPKREVYDAVHRTSGRWLTDERASASPGTVAAPGGGQPLPPRDDPRRHGGAVAPRTRWRLPRRWAFPGSCRSAASSTAHGGRWTWRRRVERIVAGVALHPNEAPRLAARGAFDETWAEIERLAAVPVRPGRGGDRPRPLPHRRGGPWRAGGLVPPAHRPGEAARQDAGHPRPRRARRRAAGGGRRRGRPSGSSCTASPATPTSPAPASSGASGCPSPAPSRSRTPAPSATPCRRSRATGSWWRPTRRSSPRCRTGAGRTPPTSCP